MLECRISAHGFKRIEKETLEGKKDDDDEGHRPGK